MNREQAIESLDANSKEWLAQILKDGGQGFGEEIVDFNPAPAQDNNWLWDEEEQMYSGQIMDDQGQVYDFQIKKDGDNWMTVTKMTKESQDAQEGTEMEEAMVVAPDKDGKCPEGYKMDDDENKCEKVEEEEVEMKEDKTKSDKDDKCWDGYERVPGTKPYEPGSENSEAKPVVPNPVAAPETVDNPAPNTEKEDEGEEMNEMKAELAKLRAEMAAYQEEKNQAKRNELAVFCEDLYEDGRLTEGMYPQKSLQLVLEGILNASIASPMVYKEGDKDISVLEGLKALLSKLPKNVEFNEAITRGIDVPLMKVPSVFGDVSKDSQKEYMKIRKYQEDNKIATFLEAKRRMHGTY